MFGVYYLKGGDYVRNERKNLSPESAKFCPLTGDLLFTSLPLELPE
jgi:hypothetical protein